MKELAVEIYDTTLRDGAQGEGLAYSVEDKLKIARGPGRDRRRLYRRRLAGRESQGHGVFRAREVAAVEHRATRRVRQHARARTPSRPTTPVVQGLLAAETPVVTIFGKSWDFHVDVALKTTLEENLRMIADTISHLEQCGRRASL